MTKLQGAIALALLCIVSVYCAFYFDGYYEKVIRNLYTTFTNGNISFFIPKKYLRFASPAFVISFGVFTTLFSFLLYRQSSKQRIINLTAVFSFFILSTLAICYCDGWLQIIGCTACDGNTRQLHYRDIDYDMIFISSLILAIIPALVTHIKNIRRRQRGRAKQSV